MRTIIIQKTSADYKTFPSSGSLGGDEKDQLDYLVSDPAPDNIDSIEDRFKKKNKKKRKKTKRNDRTNANKDRNNK